MPLRFAALILCAATLTASVRKIHLVERTDVEGFAYERIIAKVYFAVDPKLPANRIIRDIDYAPRNAEGLVEFSADLYVLKPRNPVEGNGTLLFEVSNRGRKGMVGMFDFAPGSLDPRTRADFGDAYLLKQGYTLVWIGWQPDVPMEDKLMRLTAPVAKKDGKPITGVVRAQWVPDKKETSHTLADRNHIPYAALEGSALKLTVRDHAEAPRREVPRAAWKISSDAKSVEMAAGFEPGKMYEVVYTTQDPPIIGLGPAAIRDLISFLKYENAGTTLLGEQSQHLKRAIGFGTSQSGRFLRTFLYFGFNRDEKNRKVFDGVWAHVAGAGRGSFNHRFAQPSRDGHPFMNTEYPSDIFPFSDLPQTDPETGLTDGILTKAQAESVTPKIFYTNGSYEYWGRAASLIHTTIDGRKDFEPAKDTRIYLLTGTQHGAGSFPPKRNNTQHLANPNDYRYIMRALLASMNAWLKDGKQPPASAYPRLDRGELVAHTSVAFPKLAGADLPKRIQRAWRADYGEEFRTAGIVTKEPPVLGKAFPTLVPQVDKDGNETSGIRLPEIQVPLAAYAGWNMRDASIGAPQEIFSMTGSFFAFAPSKIAQRYPSKDAYLARIREASQSLASAGYILAEDAPALEQRASRMWDALAGPN